MKTKNESAPLSKNLFVIFDKKVKTFSNPITYRTRAEAIRALTLDLRSEKSMVGQFPGDFDLYHLGGYDEFTSNIISDGAPTFVINLSELASSEV